MGAPPIAREIAEIRKVGLEKARMLEKPLAWKEKDHLSGREVEAGVIVLPTRGCFWAHRGGCSMCGYIYDAGEITQERVYKNFEEALGRLEGVEYLKLFNSGSFFDTQEISEETRERILSLLEERGVQRLQVESRPEFITSSAVEHSWSLLRGQLEVGIGLETINDSIRQKSVNKGFGREEFSKALEICRGRGVKVKAYLLIKPPFIPERLAIEDAVSSAREAFRLGADRVSFNPVNVQKYTLVEKLFQAKDYSPPWLWSVVEVLKRAKESNRVVISKPSGAGKARGASNCRECSDRVARAIERFSLTQDRSQLEGLDCRCREEWRLKLMYEEAVF